MAAALFASSAQSGSEEPQLRCGWFENPTPGNAWLADKDGEWLVGIQGGHQADGDWPDFKPSQWVRTNRPSSYGYGCACMKVSVDAKEHAITKIHSASARPLSACRNDRALKKPSN
jgi:hypothetical protein